MNKNNDVQIRIGEASLPPQLPPLNPDGTIPQLTKEQVIWINEQAAVAAAKMPAIFVNNLMLGVANGGTQVRITFAENVLNPYLPEPRVVLNLDWNVLEQFGRALLEFYMAKKKQDLANVRIPKPQNNDVSVNDGDEGALQ